MVMPIRKQKRLWLLVSFVLGLAIVACLCAAALPVSMAEPARRQDGAADDRTAPDGDVTGPLSDYADIWQRDLRKPLHDPKPVAKAAKPAPKPKLAVRLMGTVLEPGFTYAMLRGKSGETKFVGVGQSLDGAEVVEVAVSSATVRFHGDLITLKIESEGQRR